MMTAQNIPRSHSSKTSKESARAIVKFVASMQESFLHHIKQYGSIKNIMGLKQGQMWEYYMNMMEEKPSNMLQGIGIKLCNSNALNIKI